MTEFGCVTPVVGGFYMDVMQGSVTEMEIFECVGVRGKDDIFWEGAEFLMKNTKGGKAIKCWPSYWAEASPPADGRHEGNSVLDNDTA